MMIRTRFLLFTLPLLCLGACHNRIVTLKYIAPEAEQQADRGLSIRITQPKDSRPEPRNILGHMQGGILGKPSIITENDVSEWVRFAISTEVRRAGFMALSKKADSADLDLEAEVRKLEAILTSSYIARIEIRIVIRSKDKILLDRVYRGKYSRISMFARTAGINTALTSCLKDVIQQFAEDLEKIP